MDRRKFLTRCGQCAVAYAAWQAAGILPEVREAWAMQPQSGLLGAKESPYYVKTHGSGVACTLCPRGCELDDGDRGWCRVRENRGGVLYSLVYGNPCAVNVDPIEKKPFYHVLPGSQSFSLATAGCNFDCKFCQNWEISQSRPDDTMNYDLPPATIAAAGTHYGCRSVASTYVEPTIFMEYMQDIGDAARAAGMLNVMHSNGFVNREPLDDLCDRLDAACVDLKGFTESYYAEVTEGGLRPVLETLIRLGERPVHTELVNLVIPGKNDDMAQIKAMCEWVASELGRDTPLHFTRFTPRYKYKSLPPTPVKTLEEAREIGMRTGLRYVYLGNVPGHPGEDTSCPECGALLIHRQGYSVSLENIQGGKCTVCGLELPGIWD